MIVIAEPLSSWREIKQGSIEHVEGDNSNNVRGLKEKWELPDENDSENDKEAIKTLLEKWKSDDKQIINNEEHSITGLKEKWDEKDIPLSNVNEGYAEYRLDNLESNPPLQNPAQSSSSNSLDLQNDSPQGSLLTHMKDIASSQAKIIHILRRIEAKYRSDKQCSFTGVTNKQKSILDELNELDSDSLDKAALDLR